MEKKATFGAGCFWGVEAAFRRLDGVTGTRVGYAGGERENPTYEDVCYARTGHAEVVEVTYDPEHDPVRGAARDVLGRARPDAAEPPGPGRRRPVPLGDLRPRRGSSEQQPRPRASACRARHPRPVVTQIEDAPPFWEAEDYHQQYLEKRGLATAPRDSPPFPRGMSR